MYVLNKHSILRRECVQRPADPTASCDSGTYVLVVDDHALPTDRLVCARVLVNAPVTAPSAQNTSVTTKHTEKNTYKCVRDGNNCFSRT